MGKKSSGFNGFEALAGLDLGTGKIDENKKKQFDEEKDRKFADAEKRSIKNYSQENARQNRDDRNHRKGGFGKQDKYVGAPYNFVPIWENVAKVRDDERIPHDSSDEKLISGEIEYRITAVTPVIISDGKKKDAGGNLIPENFVKNHYGTYAIPGSSMSGLIRSNVQILSQSSLADDIDDYSLMYREVGGSAQTSMNKNRYDSILGDGTISVNGRSMSILKNVKAGYIEFTGKGYKFYKTQPDRISDQLGEMNYYVLSERFVFEQLSSEKTRGNFAYLRELKLQHDPSSHEFKKYTDENNRVHYICIGTDAVSKSKYAALLNAISEYNEAKKSNNKERIRETNKKMSDAKRQCRDTQNLAFEPNTYRVSYMVSNDRICAIGDEKEYDKKGYLVISGFMQEKKALYVIPEADLSSEVAFFTSNDPAIRAYQIDYENKKNQLGKARKYLELPKEHGKRKPVFYIQLDRFYFGFTPHLRLFYDHSIHDGLGKGHVPTIYDYAKSLFGLSNEQDSYKSRVSFSDATALEMPVPMEPQLIILGGPKPTSYNDYLSMKTAEMPHTYNDDGFRIRGVKQYWLRNETENKNDEYARSDDKRRKQLNNIASRFCPLPTGTVFQGKVRFHNLRREELGLLIWALRLNKDCEMNVGKGKPYGYGRIRLEISDIKALDTKAAYDTSSLNLNPFKSIMNESDAMIKDFKEELAFQLSITSADDVDNLSAIRTLMKMKNAINLPEKKDIRYMDINMREYQNRKPLKTVEETLKEKK